MGGTKGDPVRRVLKDWLGGPIPFKKKKLVERKAILDYDGKREPSHDFVYKDERKKRYRATAREMGATRSGGGGADNRSLRR